MLERVGVCCLGLFVGYLLALGLAHSKPTLRLVLTVLGAALGGVPIAFLAQSGSKWAYPIGLLIGFLIFRVRHAHAYLFASPAQSASGALLPDQRARVELFLIASFIISLTALALLLPAQLTRTESGEFKLGENVGRQSVRYSSPFQNAPRLIIKRSDYATYRIEDETAEGFVFVPQGFVSGSVISWEATGVARDFSP